MNANNGQSRIVQPIPEPDSCFGQQAAKAIEHTSPEDTPGLPCEQRPSVGQQRSRLGFVALMEQVRAGSEDAAWELLERYGSKILRVVRRKLHHRMRPKFDSQDFVQAAWLSFFAHRSQIIHFDSEAQLIGFLASVASNKVVDEVRKRLDTQKHNVNRERSLQGMEGSGTGGLAARQDTPSQVAIARERWNRLLEGQPEHYREIVRLRYHGGTYQEIATALEIDERTVRRVLKKLFQEQDDMPD